MTQPRNIRVFTSIIDAETTSQCAIVADQVVLYGPIAGGAGGTWIQTTAGSLKVREKFAEVHHWMFAPKVQDAVAPEPADTPSANSDKHAPVGVAWGKPAKKDKRK